ncbi:ribonuclease H-like domain-containing protein [Tanacetum coccineum]|uniref:Ribonuclease H-like domain-containing protein n=1 Tax=Tanacetum coccineum TaxID=301880 RepID=A0ABQ5HH91_9ASTR
MPPTPSSISDQRCTLSRYKDRLVANGSTQLEGVDIDETFSPVLKPGTIRTVLSLATSRHLPVHQLDVKNEFLHDDLSEMVYMHQPPGFQDFTHPDNLCLLQRSLYGLKQASQALFQRFAAYITRVGFTHSRCISIIRDSSGMFLSQHKYSTDTLEQAHMVNCNPSRTHVDTESKHGDDGDPVSNPTLYRSLAGSFIYQRLTEFETLSRSSVEAEYRGVANVVAETCWLRNLLLYLSSNPVQHQRTKHIEIGIHFVRDLVAAGQVRVLHVPSVISMRTFSLKAYRLSYQFKRSMSSRSFCGGVLVDIICIGLKPKF